MQGRGLAEQAQQSEKRQVQLMHELQEQHQQQMARMSQEYERCWHSPNTAQMETSDAVTALESNLSDAKFVMQGRIGDTEVRLGQLQSWQEELADNQNDFQADVREELLRIKSALESSTCHEPKEQLPICKPLSTTLTCKPESSSIDDSGKPGPKPLSVTAPAFIPSAGSTTLCSGGTADVVTEGSGPTNVQRPSPFDGKSTWGRSLLPLLIPLILFIVVMPQTCLKMDLFIIQESVC